MSPEPKDPLPSAIVRIAPDGQPTARQRRRILIEMCLRRIKPGTFTSPELLSRRTAVNKWPNLNKILEGIPWVITGGVATRAYMPERMTHDLDILIHKSNCESAWRKFKEHGFVVADVLDAPYFVARRADIPEVDVLCLDFPWLERAFVEARQDPAGFPVLDLPFLIIMKLKANRGIDIGDMTRMLGLASEEDRDRVRKTVALYQPEDSDDLEALILLGKMEFRDMSRSHPELPEE
jgi:hypothetical protein